MKRRLGVACAAAGCRATANTRSIARPRPIPEWFPKELLKRNGGSHVCPKCFRRTWGAVREGAAGSPASDASGASTPRGIDPRQLVFNSARRASPAVPASPARTRRAKENASPGRLARNRDLVATRARLDSECGDATAPVALFVQVVLSMRHDTVERVFNDREVACSGKMELRDYGVGAGGRVTIKVKCRSGARCGKLITVHLGCDRKTVHLTPPKAQGARGGRGYDEHVVRFVTKACLEGLSVDEIVSLAKTAAATGASALSKLGKTTVSRIATSVWRAAEKVGKAAVAQAKAESVAYHRAPHPNGKMTVAVDGAWAHRRESPHHQLTMVDVRTRKIIAVGILDMGRRGTKRKRRAARAFSSDDDDDGDGSTDGDDDGDKCASIDDDSRDNASDETGSDDDDSDSADGRGDDDSGDDDDSDDGGERAKKQRGI